MTSAKTQRSDSEAEPPKYLLGRPLPLMGLSSLTLTNNDLKIFRKTRLSSLLALHRSELKRLGGAGRQAKRRASILRDPETRSAKVAEAERLHRMIDRLAERYSEQEAEVDTWVPKYSSRNEHAGVSFDPVKFHLLGNSLQAHFKHIPSFFSCEWIGSGGQTETLRHFSHRPVCKEAKAYDERVMVRQEILNDAVFKDWILEVYGTFSDWVPPPQNGRPSRVAGVFTRLSRRKIPKLLTLEVANHYVPGLGMTEGYLDALLKPRSLGEAPLRVAAQRKTIEPLPHEPQTRRTSSSLEALIQSIEEMTRNKNRARAARRVTLSS